jgi:hypothetical protein
MRNLGTSRQSMSKRSAPPKLQTPDSTFLGAEPGAERRFEETRQRLQTLFSEAGHEIQTDEEERVELAPGRADRAEVASLKAKYRARTVHSNGA